MRKSHVIVFLNLLLSGCVTPQQQAALQRQQQDQQYQLLTAAQPA